MDTADDGNTELPVWNGPHVIFDMDGVLLDSEPIYVKVEGAMLRELCDGDYDKMLHKIIGRTTHDTAAVIIEEYNLNITVGEYIQRRNEVLLPAMTHVEIFPGVERLVSSLKASGVKIAVATSSPRNLLEAKKTGKADFFRLFDAIVCGDDVINGKPSPEIFLKAAAAIGEEPSNCIVFEDAPAGVRGAKAAGMRCVAIPNLEVDQDLYKEASPDFSIRSILELVPESVGLPSYI
jgi:pseudouridine 5'-phosphatase